MKKRNFSIFVTILLIGLALLVPKGVFAQGCGINDFTMNPSDPYTLGTHVQLHVTSSCGTVRFEINGQPKAEIGSSEQWETWKTEEFGSGSFEVCAVARGDGGWGNADRRCRTVYVEGGQAPPSGSTQNENAKCWVNSFYITPDSGPIGTNFNLASQGQCDGNMRAARYSIDGDVFGEHSNNTYNTSWNSSGYSAGKHTICYLVTAGSWDQAAKSCTKITLTETGTSSHGIAGGEQSTNGQSGQTDSSGPGGSSSSQGGGTQSQGNSSENCAGSPIAFIEGQLAEVLPGPANNLRRDPSVEANKIGKIPAGGRFSVVGGPRCADGYWWWKVVFQGLEGWTAQGDGETIWIIGLANSNSTSSSLPSQTPKPTETTIPRRLGQEPESASESNQISTCQAKPVSTYLGFWPLEDFLDWIVIFDTKISVEQGQLEIRKNGEIVSSGLDVEKPAPNLWKLSVGSFENPLNWTMNFRVSGPCP